MKNTTAHWSLFWSRPLAPRPRSVWVVNAAAITCAPAALAFQGSRTNYTGPPVNSVGQSDFHQEVRHEAERQTVAHVLSDLDVRDSVLPSGQQGRKGEYLFYSVTCVGTGIIIPNILWVLIGAE